MSYYQTIKDTQRAARKVARETGKPAAERRMRGEFFMVDSIYVNEHGTWGIKRIITERGYRWQLYLNQDGQWMLVANQGRRKTCIELADANYRG
jgi:hypothetical protein